MMITMAVDTSKTTSVLSKQLLLVLSMYVAVCVVSSCYAMTKARSVILISFDGFRWNYLDRDDVHLPTLRKIATETGVRAELTNIFVRM